ncbi:MAG: hypothetical protein EBW19_03035, partial [Betaproteobacteria bacterium]|nr:hypothetical protein [Betaproteobacteria bacterium]
LPGLIGRDPWRGDDAVGLGVAYNMLLALRAGEFDNWLLSRLPGVLLPDEGPFPFWIASLLGWLTQALPLDFALLVRLLWVACWLASLLLCWRAVYRLSKRPEWIPHDPIGIAASPRKLAAALADSSVLFLLATVGLVERVHETSPEAFAILIMAAAFYCLAWSLDSPRKAGWAFGTVIVAAWLSKGLWFGLALSLSLMILAQASAHWQSIAKAMILRAALTVAAMLALWFGLMYRDGSEAGLAENLRANAQRLDWMAAWWALQFSGPAKGLGVRLYDLAREPWWFFWPVWPAAVWALWQLRDRIREPSLIAPASLISTIIFLSPFAPGSSLAWLMPLAVPLAALAALGLPTLRQGLVQFMDWYAVLIYGLIAFMFWAYFLAWLIGWPEPMAYRMGILARSEQAADYWPGLLAGLAISLAWVLLVRWRLSRQPSVLWKPVLLASSGLVLIWFLFQILFLEGHNRRNSYREMAAQVSESMRASDGCVHAEDLRPGVQASLQWFAGIQFAESGKCQWLIIQDSGEALRRIAPRLAGWQLQWVGARRGEKQERFRLYLRSPSAESDR